MPTRDDLIYKEECYRVVGMLYKVFNDLGGELLEKHYQKAVAVEFESERIKFTEQYPVKLYYKGKFIGIYYVDFYITIGDANIILEIKKHENFGLKNIKQLDSYIKSASVKLGILANFTKSGVKYKRIVNLQKQH